MSGLLTSWLPFLTQSATQQPQSATQQPQSATQQPQSATPASSATQLVHLAAINLLAQQQPLFKWTTEKPHKLKTKIKGVIKKKAPAPLLPGQMTEAYHGYLKRHLVVHVVGRNADNDEKLRKVLELAREMAALFTEMIDAKSALNRAINTLVASGAHPAGAPNKPVKKQLAIFYEVKSRFDDADGKARHLLTN